MRYEHTQKAPLYLAVLLPGVLCVVAGILGDGLQGARVILWVMGALMIVLALCFMWLAVRDEGDALAIRFGPLPLFRRRLPYARLRGAGVERSRILDGWGVHWTPGQGWIWNLWGRDCVAVELDPGRLRIGTDDPQGLLRHLQRRIEGGAR